MLVEMKLKDEVVEIVVKDAVITVCSDFYTEYFYVEMKDGSKFKELGSLSSAYKYALELTK